MRPFGPSTIAVALAAASLLAYRASRKKTLSLSGTACGFTVGFLLVATGLRGLNLFVFYQIGSSATQYQQHKKADHDETVSYASTRGFKQVLAVSVIAVLLSLYHALEFGPEQAFTRENPEQTRLACAILAHHATSLADTLASELGMLSNEQPRSILTFRRVPPGTNGGVTVAGTMWSLAGGACIGLSTVLLDIVSDIPNRYIPRIIMFAATCGLFGSIVDSLVGASIQITYWNETTKKVCHENSMIHKSKRIAGVDILTNEQVNFVSLLISTYVGGWILGPWFFDLHGHA